MRIATRQITGNAAFQPSCPSRHAASASGQPRSSVLAHPETVESEMTGQITIQAPDAPATGKQWGLIRHLAHEAGFQTAREAVIDVLGSYTKGAFTRELASAVITALKVRQTIPADEQPLAIEPPTATPQVDALAGMAPMGWADRTNGATEPEFDLGAADEPTVAVQCAHWGTLAVREVEPDPRYPDETEHEISCTRCGANWAQVESSAPAAIQ